MARALQTTCDICGCPKRQSNHWWIVWTNERGALAAAPADRAAESISSASMGWTQKDFCGQEHALRFIGETMAKA